MKIAAREMNLLGITLAVVLLALSYLVLDPKFQEWGAFRDQRIELQTRLDRATQMLDSQGMVESQLAEFRKGLPVFPPNEDMDTELMQSLDKMAGQQGLTVTKREAKPEREAGDLYETSIKCQWEGYLPALVKFLYAQQSLGAVSDVRELSVSPMGKKRDTSSDRLKGSFTMDYAYRREAAAIESPSDVAGPKPVTEEAQP